MNALMITIALATASTMSLLTYTLSYAASHKNRKPDPRSQKSFRLFTAIFATLFIASGIALYMTINKYSAYGAFYDDSWKDPNVDSRFLFDTNDTKTLQALYDSDPDAFNPELYPVILVRLGCEDCEVAYDRIMAAKTEIETKRPITAYIVFSRSDIGKIYVNKYNVTNVPVVIIDNACITLYNNNNNNN